MAMKQILEGRKMALLLVYISAFLGGQNHIRSLDTVRSMYSVIFLKSKCMNHDSVNYHIYVPGFSICFYPNHDVTFGLFGISACSRICFKICRLYAVGRKQVKYEILSKWDICKGFKDLQGVLE